MGLLRTALVVGALVALLPSEKESQARLFDGATNAARWTITFCDRNGETCQRGAALWTAFRAKAEFAARVAYDVASETLARTGDTSGDRTAASSAEPTPAPAVAPATPVAPTRLQGSDAGVLNRGTLTTRDLAPAFRTGSRRQGA